MNRRWSCPTGEHPSVLAPGKLRKKDIRRYCLPCSEVVGILVERRCAAHEKRAERSKAKAARKRERAKQLSWRGLDLGWELGRLWELHWKLGNIGAWPCPKLVVRKSSAKSHTTARAYTRPLTRRVVITIGTDATAGEVLGTLAHEVCHFSESGILGHGKEFWRRLDGLAKARWGVCSGGIFRGGWRRQQALENAIDRKLDETST